MSLRTTIALVIVAAIVGVVAYINPFTSEETRKPKPPWFYQVSEDDIEGITVTTRTDKVSFVKTGKRTWMFKDPAGIPPSYYRWGGIPLLLSGPQTRRDFSEDVEHEYFQITTQVIEDPAEFGLDDPRATVHIKLTADRELLFTLGDSTTDGSHIYGQVEGFPQLFIIADIWGKVVGRLADEKPYPKWYVKRDPAIIRGLNVFMGDVTSPETPFVHFYLEEDDGLWYACENCSNDKEKIRLVDLERWKEILPLLSGPPNVHVAVPRVEDRDFEQWGINDEAVGIEITFDEVREQAGRKYDIIGGLPIRIGDKTEDGNWDYAIHQDDEQIVKPVLLVEAEWVETLLGLHADIPYAPEPQASDPSG